MKVRVLLVASGIGFLLGGLSVYEYIVLTTPAPVLDTSHQVREGRGVYTNPLLECDVAQGSINAPKVRFERQLKAKVAEIDARSSISDIAVYYRDLTNGPAFGVQEGKPFFPASLLKVPLYMAFLKHSESDRTFLQKKVRFTRTKPVDGVTQTILPEKHLIDGKEYTIDELLTQLITYSDNEALDTLYPILPDSDYADLYARLGIDDVSSSNPLTTLTVVEYSTFFRVLFNASYLSQENSEKALGLLTQTTYDKGLRAGVPQTLKVAHKFGERDLEDGQYQLHDCGIVYLPKTPYMLCVMTRGTNQAALATAIRDISAFTYTQVAAQQGGQN